MSFFFYSGVHVSKAKISFSSISLCFVFWKQNLHVCITKVT
jgi:hypothetical protein